VLKGIAYIKEVIEEIFTLASVKAVLQRNNVNYEQETKFWLPGDNYDSVCCDYL
jgi:hypothetical protein